jgi:hypothetical protein
MAVYPNLAELKQEQYANSTLGGYSAAQSNYDRIMPMPTSAGPSGYGSVTKEGQKTPFQVASGGMSGAAPTMIKAPTLSPPPGAGQPIAVTPTPAAREGVITSNDGMIGNWANQGIYGIGTNAGGSDYAKYSDYFDLFGKNNDWENYQDQVTGKYGDAVRMNSGDVWVGGEGGSMQHQASANIDWSKMPGQGMTKAGRLDSVTRANDAGSLIDPNKRVWDPNYGWVTPKNNIRDDHNWAEKLAGNGALMASLAMGGLMGVGLPAGMLAAGVKAGFGAMPGLTNGNWQSSLMNLAGAGLGSYYNVDPRLIAAGKTAAGYALNGKG